MITHKMNSRLPLFVCNSAAFVALIGSALAIEEASAQAWSATPEIVLQGEYNDNARLEVDDALQNEISGADLEASVRFLRRSPTGSFLFLPRVSTSYYPDDRDDDSTDAFVLLSGEHRTQRSIWSLRTRYSDEQVRSAEIEDPDFGNPDIDRPITDDTGFIQVKNRRSRFVLSPSAQFRVSERNWLGIVADYHVTSYDQQFAELRDNDYGYVEVNFRRELSPKTALTLRAYGGTYESDDGDFSSDTSGIGAQIDHDISERSSFFVLAGAIQVDSDFVVAGVPDSGSEDEFIAGLGLTRNFEISRLVLDLRHSVNPAGGTFLTERTQLRARLTRQLTPLVTGRVSVRVQATSAVPESTVVLDRDQGRLSLGLEWQLSRNWSFVANYAFTRQEFEGQGDASSNSVGLGFRYAPPRRN